MTDDKKSDSADGTEDLATNLFARLNSPPSCCDLEMLCVYSVRYQIGAYKPVEELVLGLGFADAIQAIQESAKEQVDRRRASDIAQGKPPTDEWLYVLKIEEIGRLGNISRDTMRSLLRSLLTWIDG